MKYCYKCGHQLNDSDLFCDRCGEKQYAAHTNVSAENQPPVSNGTMPADQSAVNFTPSQGYYPQNVQPAAKSNKKLALIFGISAGALVLITGIVIAIVASSKVPAIYDDYQSDYYSSSYNSSSNGSSNGSSSSYSNNSSSSYSNNSSSSSFYDDDDGICSMCHGSGICQVCFGKRQWYTPSYGTDVDTTVTCQGCDGSGKCWKCNGTGRA